MCLRAKEQDLQLQLHSFNHISHMLCYYCPTVKVPLADDDVCIFCLLVSLHSPLPLSIFHS